jgi:hypothetical protein
LSHAKLVTETVGFCVEFAECHVARWAVVSELVEDELAIADNF